VTFLVETPKNSSFGAQHNSTFYIFNFPFLIFSTPNNPFVEKSKGVSLWNWVYLGEINARSDFVKKEYR
jgi:hypothetical protein